MNFNGFIEILTKHDSKNITLWILTNLPRLENTELYTDRDSLDTRKFCKMGHRGQPKISLRRNKGRLISAKIHEFTIKIQVRKILH